MRSPANLQELPKTTHRLSCTVTSIISSSITELNELSSLPTSAVSMKTARLTSTLVIVTLLKLIDSLKSPAST